MCWSVKRALLSQGYMLDRSTESGVLTGTRDFQPDQKLNVSYHLQTTCADNRDGTSIVFVTATREDSQLHRFFDLVQGFIGEERVADQQKSRPEEGHAEVRNQ